MFNKLVIDCAVGSSLGFGEPSLCVLEYQDPWVLHRYNVSHGFAVCNWLLTPGFTFRAWILLILL